LDYLFWLAMDNKSGWIRFDPRSEKDLILIKESFDKIDRKKRGVDIIKAPHDVQSKEIFIIDISKTEEELLVEMKSKTRYNVRLAEKKGVVIKEGKQYIEDFLRLSKETAQRDGIVIHPEEYYKKMIENLPADMIKLYVAEYEGKILAANIVIFFEDSATYAHGASSNESRDVMAPYLLQWRQIQDAKEKGYSFYDFGGVKTKSNGKSWAGITRFKTGFSPKTESIVFPGSYDIIISPRKYSLYKGLQKAKVFLGKIRQ